MEGGVRPAKALQEVLRLTGPGFYLPAWFELVGLDDQNEAIEACDAIATAFPDRAEPLLFRALIIALAAEQLQTIVDNAVSLGQGQLAEVQELTAEIAGYRIAAAQGLKAAGQRQGLDATLERCSQGFRSVVEAIRSWGDE